jgi:soluble lytic murein transglycosylase-like protein
MMPIFISDVPLHCINDAAYEYKIPAKLIIAVLNTERGKIGLESRNKNGLYDLGPMQINTSWWPKLYAYKITKQEALFNPCVNVKVGAWILAKSIASGNDLLCGIGNYNSHSRIYNRNYTKQIRIKYSVIQHILS